MDEAAEEYARTNPDRERVAPLFELAKVDYGRIDFSIHQGRIQVWEINDNPEFVTYPFTSQSRYEMWARELSRLGDGKGRQEPISITV